MSRDKHDLGLSSTIMHDVELSDKTPVYTQQYRLPLEQLNLIKEHLAAWIKSGIASGNPCSAELTQLFACLVIE